MDGLAITNKEFELFTEEEIKTLIPKSKTHIKDSAVFFTGEKRDLMKLAYKAQSVKRIIIYLADFEFGSLDDIEEKSKIDYSKYISSDDKFRVNCETVDCSISSQDIERAVGKNVPFAVDLKNPDKSIFCYVFKNHCYIGLDISGKDLSKRYYKIFSDAGSIKGTLAYFLLRIAGYSGKEILLDPFSGSGTIPIEAAYMSSGLSLNYYCKDDLFFAKFDVFRDLTDNFFKEEDADTKEPPKSPNIFAYDNQLSKVNSVKKNAKIAGLSKFISLGRGEVDWIDTKFEENSVDYVVSNPPRWNKFNDKKNTKMFEQFFHRIKPVVKKSGVIALLTNSEKVVKIAADKGFFLKNKKSFSIGNNIYHILVFNKK